MFFWFSAVARESVCLCTCVILILLSRAPFPFPQLPVCLFYQRLFRLCHGLGWVVFWLHWASHTFEESVPMTLYVSTPLFHRCQHTHWNWSFEAFCTERVSVRRKWEQLNGEFCMCLMNEDWKILVSCAKCAWWLPLNLLPYSYSSSDHLFLVSLAS